MGGSGSGVGSLGGSGSGVGSLGGSGSGLGSLGGSGVGALGSGLGSLGGSGDGSLCDEEIKEKPHKKKQNVLISIHDIYMYVVRNTSCVLCNFTHRLW